MLEIARSRFKDLSKRTADLHIQACYIGNDIVDRAVAIGLDTLDHYSVSRENIFILKGYRARTCGIPIIALPDLYASFDAEKNGMLYITIATHGTPMDTVN